MAGKSEPSFGQGASGYGLYYAHTFADGTIENYMVEAIVPAITREDPRYYTLGHGGFFKRTGYAISRVFITRNDAGNNTFNFSEIVGAGAAAGISNAYYPPGNTWVKTYQRWESQILQDAISVRLQGILARHQPRRLSQQVLIRPAVPFPLQYFVYQLS